MLSTYFIQKFLKQKIVPKSTIALGTSSVSLQVLKELAIHNVINDLDLKLVPTSTDIAHLAHEFNIRLSPINHKIDLCIDFADYADSYFNYIKTSTQSLIRDKMVAKYAKENMVFAYEEDFNAQNIPAIPLEVSRFGTHLIEKELFAFGDAKIRTTKLGQRYKTLETNYIIDLKLNTKILDFDDLDYKLNTIPGILETGLFVSYADKLFTVNKTKIKEELNKIR
ncbi:MAG: hypothetical protein COT14_00570 [Candidatus Diapherotrites archaeon CG08_land_8_20_14_0_20_30_16]|nr:MAG: hypothetical protein COT14_00570 [Candidatus Diapherotrites archaeon CG08_land_8_20_14_0_20_30_16]